MHLQSAQLLRPRLRKPDHHGTARVGFDELLGHPQPFCGPLDLNPDKPVRGYTKLCEPGGVRLLRGRDEVDGASFLGQERWYCWPQQAPFADGGLREQQFGKTAGWPATARKLGIKDLKAAADNARIHLAQFCPTPYGLRHVRWQGSGELFRSNDCRWAWRRLGAFLPQGEGRHGGL